MLTTILIILGIIALGIYLLPFVLFTSILLVGVTGIIFEEIWLYLKGLFK